MHNLPSLAWLQKALLKLGFTGGGSGVTTFLGLSDTPVNYVGQAGRKIIVSQDELGIEFQTSTSLSGFNNPHNVTMSFVGGVTRKLSLDPTDTIAYFFASNSGTEYSKAGDEITIPDVEGLHYVYYDNNGDLQSITNPDRITQRNEMIATLPVAYILWDATNKIGNFVTEVLKDKSMVIGAYVKNFYDEQIYTLQGLGLGNDPSVGGTVTPSGDVDASARFSLTEGASLFTDKVFTMNAKLTTANWDIAYLDADKVRIVTKTGFPILQDTDLGVDVTGRVLYNNGAFPQVVTNNRFVWYYVGISNDIDINKRVIMFMGQNEYTSIALARANILVETEDVERSFSIRQEFAIMYAVLFQTSNSYANGVQSRIVDVKNLAGLRGELL